MKVIELLNKIANSEEVPNKIKAKNYIWTYEKEFKQYKNNNFQELIKFLLGYYDGGACHFTIWGMLNYEIEILEDEIDIDIDSIAEITRGYISNIDGLADGRVKNKINELVQAVKQLNKEVKKLEEDK